jgi:hypothetical protein
MGSLFRGKRRLQPRRYASARARRRAAPEAVQAEDVDCPPTIAGGSASSMARKTRWTGCGLPAAHHPPALWRGQPGTAPRPAPSHSRRPSRPAERRAEPPGRTRPSDDQLVNSYALPVGGGAFTKRAPPPRDGRRDRQSGPVAFCVVRCDVRPAPRLETLFPIAPGDTLEDEADVSQTQLASPRSACGRA